MTERDDVVDTLRRHRPDDLPDAEVSAHAPAAQALLEEILSMQTIEPHETAGDAPDVVTAPRPHRRVTPHALMAAGSAAAAAAVVVAAASVLLPSPEPSPATTVDTALARSLETLDVSGRAEVTTVEVYVDEQGDRAFVQDGVDTWEYAGDDSSVTLTHRIDGIDAIPGDVDPINRRVDGEVYLYVPAGADEYRWYHDPGLDGTADDAFRADPATLLDQLRSAGEFEDVGSGSVDGVETRRLRASRPGDAPVEILRESWGQLGEPSDLEVWVDDEGLVRRVDLSFASDELPRPPDTLAVSSATISVRFFDFGEPISIQAPADAIELSGDGS